MAGDERRVVERKATKVKVIGNFLLGHNPSSREKDIAHRIPLVKEFFLSSKVNIIKVLFVT